MPYFYHFTKSSYCENIRKQKVIKKSIDKNAKFGPGVYLTKKSFMFGKEKLARNNYDGNRTKISERRIQEGYLDAYVRIFIPEDEVEKCKTKKDRDIWRYDGDLDLKKYRYQWGPLEDSKQKERLLIQRKWIESHMF